MVMSCTFRVAQRAKYLNKARAPGYIDRKSIVQHAHFPFQYFDVIKHNDVFTLICIEKKIKV